MTRGELPPTPEEQPSRAARWSLALALGCWLPLLNIVLVVPAVWMSHRELRRIERGESPQAGRPMARFGFWASLIHLVLFTLGFGGVLCVVGASFLATGWASSM